MHLHKNISVIVVVVCGHWHTLYAEVPMRLKVTVEPQPNFTRPSSLPHNPSYIAAYVLSQYILMRKLRNGVHYNNLEGVVIRCTFRYGCISSRAIVRLV